MKKKDKDQAKLLNSEEVARELGVGYDTLMRWMRAGFVRPAAYTGRHRVPVLWTSEEIGRAALVRDLFHLGTTKQEAQYVLAHRGDLFEKGYTPFWVVQRLNDKREIIGRALALSPPGPDLPRSQWIRGITDESTPYTISASVIHVPLSDWTKKLRPKKRTPAKRSARRK